MKSIDAHSHIDYITHRIQPNVVGTVVCAVQEGDWKCLVDIAEMRDNVYAAFGVHPWFLDSVTDGVESRLEDLLKYNPNFMVGEIGLDKYKPDMEKQITYFIKQFDVAVKLQRSVFIHCVGAWDKMFYILKQYNNTDLPKIIFHAFNGGEDIINNLLKHYNNNVMFSLDKNAVYDRNCRIQQIPIDKILVESDAKNDSDLVKIIEKISEIKNNVNADDIIYNNTLRVLKNG